MRPTDENQAASTRPNLMSSRRGAGEDNILAMLERDSARRPGARMSGVRLASYGAAAALAGILAGGVAWLAYDNHKTAQELQFQHDAATSTVPLVMADADLPPLPPPSPGPSPTIDAPRTAVIVDESARARDATVASAVPPLVMLPPHEVKGAKPTLPAPRLVRDVTPAVTPPKPAKSGAPQAAPRVLVEKKAEKAPKLASRAAKTRPARAVAPAKGRAEAAATRTRKAAAAAKTAATPVDSDVALISAIISHAERHRGERDAASSCSGAKCPPPKRARP